MSDWQPIETAPKGQATRDDGPSILLTNGDSIFIGFWNGRSWDDGDYFHRLGTMTHWMPLPALPKPEATAPGEAVQQ